MDETRPHQTSVQKRPFAWYSVIVPCMEGAHENCMATDTAVSSKPNPKIYVQGGLTI